jgi:hypothetical protein
MTVAQRRLRSVVEPPAELVEFDVEEWAAPDDHSSWQAFERWKDGRHQWVKTHGKEAILGGLVNVMREEHEMHMERLRNGTVA